MNRLVAIIVTVLLVGGCTDDGPEPRQVGPETIKALREEIAAVARSQRAADESMARVLSAVRELDIIIGALRDPATVDRARGDFERVEQAVAAAAPEVEDLRQPLIEVASAVDRARTILDEVRDSEDDEWTVAYLDAEDEVLLQVRDYAETADALARALITHWPTYSALHEATATFVEQRWFYRTDQEAADAYELAISRLLRRLEVAQEEIGDAIQEREQAAAAVNQAAARARQVWNERPGG